MTDLDRYRQMLKDFGVEFEEQKNTRNGAVAIVVDDERYEHGFSFDFHENGAFWGCGSWGQGDDI